MELAAALALTILLGLTAVMRGFAKDPSGSRFLKEMTMADDIKEGVLTHREESPTAASSHNRLYGTTRSLDYRVMVATGMGMIPHVVTAESGDDAAEQTLRQFPGAKVAHVEPAAR